MILYLNLYKSVFYKLCFGKTGLTEGSEMFQGVKYTACDFPNNKPIMVNTNKYNYILFFRNIMPLKLII